MVSFTVVEVFEISPERGARLADRIVDLEVDLLIFDGTPQPFHEHVVALGAFAVHADLDAMFEQQAGELVAGELLTSMDQHIAFDGRRPPDWCLETIGGGEPCQVLAIVIGMMLPVGALAITALK